MHEQRATWHDHQYSGLTGSTFQAACLLPCGADLDTSLSLQDMHQEIQDVLGQNFGIPDDIDEDELMEELDALEDDLTADTEANADGVPSYLQVVSQCLYASVGMAATCLPLGKIMHTYILTLRCQEPLHSLLR